MNRRDLAIHGFLLAGILAAAYMLVEFQPADVDKLPLRVPVPGNAEPIETSGPVRLRREAIDRTADTSLLVRCNPFTTLIEAPPPPPPPPPTPEPKPPLVAVMAPYELAMADPSRGRLVLQHKTSGRMLEWRVGETKTLSYRGRNLAVTLRQIGSATFNAVFTAPDDQVCTFSYFESGFAR